jgi:hypothetical protein
MSCAKIYLRKFRKLNFFEEYIKKREGKEIEGRERKRGKE